MSSSSSAGAAQAPENPHPILQSPEKPSLAGPRTNSSTLDAANDRSVLATPSYDAKPPVESTEAAPSFPLLADNDNVADKQGTPVAVASGAKSAQELLHRLSLVDGTRPTASESLPQDEHPGLHLTGRVISATFCIPYKLGFRSNSDDPWVRYCFIS